MARVLMSNPPLWVEKKADHWIAMVRAGSRWPFSMPVTSSPDHFHFGGYLPSPMFMQYATSFLAAQPGVEVDFRDSIALRESMTSFLRATDEGYDYLFFESASPSWDHDAGAIQLIHQRHPRLKIVLCGTIAVRGEALLREQPLHAVIQGEYEKGAVRVVCGGESGLIGHDFLTEAEMNAAPFPFMSAKYAHRYWDPCPKGQVHPHAQVWASRGCVYKCSFCEWPAQMTGDDPTGEAKRTMRFYREEYLEGLLSEWKAKYRFRSVYFDGDLENYGDRHTLAICRVMRKIGLPWSAMCRIDTVKRETWKEMKDSGCYGVKVGFESGSQRVIDEIIRKQLDLEKARETVAYLKSIGLTVHGTFSYGHPGETHEEMKLTRAYRESLGLDTFQESGVAHLDGAPIERLLQVGRLNKYPGATPEGYSAERDGAKKMLAIQEALRA